MMLRVALKRLLPMMLAAGLLLTGCGGADDTDATATTTGEDNGATFTTTASTTANDSVGSTTSTDGDNSISTGGDSSVTSTTSTTKTTATTKPTTVAFKNALKNTVKGNFSTDPLQADGELYGEANRNQFHYSTKFGWGNDPNGLVYYEGEWHLFYQHNAEYNFFGRCWWGHAVSKDLIHWEELAPALAPTDKYNIWSGSCVVDKNDTTGFFDGGSGLVAMFTYAETNNNQCQGIAYSKDKGRTWTMIEEPVLYTDGEQAFRDPKVFWHEESGKWIAIIAGGQVRIYSSPNLKDWTLECKPSIWTECPDMFPMKVEGTNETKWVISLAGKGFVVGDFDGKTFTPLTGSIMNEDSPDRYAGQTFFNAPDGRRIEVVWFGSWTYGTELATMLPGNAVYSLPVELSLVKNGNDYKIVRTPIKEIDSLRGEKVFSAKNGYVKADSANLFKDIAAKTLDIELTFVPKGDEVIGFKFRTGTDQEVVVSYDCSKQKLYVDRSKTVSKPKIKSFNRKYNTVIEPNANGEVTLRIMLDWNGVEIFANDGTVMSALLLPDKAADDVEFYVENGTAQIVSLDAWRVNSIWK